jgi:hypothetical protein
LALLAALLLSLPALAQSPTVEISKVRGVPRVDIRATTSTCPDGGLSMETRQAIVDNAAAEWAGFRFPRFSFTWLRRSHVLPPGLSPQQRRTRARGYVPRILAVGYREDDEAVRQRIGNYWASLPARQRESVFGAQNAVWQASDGRAGWAEYWSAAFIAYVMCKSGLSEREFIRDWAHRSYIGAAVEQRAGTRLGFAYRAIDIEEGSPAAGDLICAAREGEDYAINDLKDFRARPGHGSYHCDIVVGFDVANPRMAGIVYSIGGNVINAVSLTESPMANGRLVRVRVAGARNWFTILKLDAQAGPADFRRIPAELVQKAEQVARSRQSK